MLKILTGCILCVVMTSTTQAANVLTFGSEAMVVFPHQKHQENLGGCTDCHGAKEPGRFPEFGEQWAHATCRGCHNENKTGPVECSGCHMSS